ERMHENEISKIIVDAAYQIHRSLGPGLFESVYEAILAHELTERGMHVERQKILPLTWKDIRLDEGFGADRIVEKLVIVELEAVVQAVRAFKAQLLTYLRVSNLRLGILINFGEELFKDGVFRVVNDLPEVSHETHLEHSRT